MHTAKSNIMSETPQQNNLKQFFRGSKQSAPTKDTDAAPNPSKKQRRIQVDISQVIAVQ